MQVTETHSEGLKRGYTFTLPGKTLEETVGRKLAEAQPEIEMKGFRKGKVPMAMLKKQFGPRILGDAMQEAIDGALKKHLDESGDRPATQPKVEMQNGETWKEGDDVVVNVSYEALPAIRERAAGRPVALGGWSFGGALAVEVARQLREAGDEVALVVLLDTVQPSEPVPDTLDESVERWRRYSDFARRTYGIDVEVPREFLAEHGEDGVLEMLLAGLGEQAGAMGGGVIEHQRASFVDNRILQSADLGRWRGVGAEVPFVLYRAERMHDGAIELEPRYASVDPDGGWARIVEDLDIVRLSGDHLAVVDEPEIGKVGQHLTRRLAAIDAATGGEKGDR